MRVKDAVGRFGEQVAADHLEAKGLQVLARNWRCRDGELDIVAQDGRTLVFVEVKTRSTTAFGTPAEAVGRVKAARIRQLAVRWLQTERSAGTSSLTWPTLRFDVVSVLRGRDGVQIDHVKGAF
jgi:putative endonuclease